MEPAFILFAVLIWSSTAAWTFAVSKVLLDRAAPIESSVELLRFAEFAYVASILPSVILWAGLAPYIAGYGRIVFFLEGFTGLAVSAIIASFVIVSLPKEKNFIVPSSDSNHEAP